MSSIIDIIIQFIYVIYIFDSDKKDKKIRNYVWIH
jgi:hypothetical protein